MKTGLDTCIAQTNCNPFMANNDHIKDLEIQDSFLKPQKFRIIRNGDN